MLVTFGIYFKQHFDTRYLVFYNPSPPRMFLSLDLSEYRIQRGAIGPLYVTSSYSTWIFCRGVSGFATDCPCDVWCRGLTTCLLHVGPPFGNRFLAATKQLYDWFSPSVCLSVCLSVRPSVCLSHLFHHVPIIVSSWNFQELLPWSKVMSMQKVKVRGQRSRSQRSTPNLAVSGLLTPVWIHIWQWNHAHSWKQHKRGALLFFKVIRQISRSHGSKNRRIWPRLVVSGL